MIDAYIDFSSYVLQLIIVLLLFLKVIYGHMEDVVAAGGSVPCC